MFARVERGEIAATLFGTTTHHADTKILSDLSDASTRLRAELGDVVFERCAADGAAMELADAVRYSHLQISLWHAASSSTS